MKIIKILLFFFLFSVCAFAGETKINLKKLSENIDLDALPTSRRHFLGNLRAAERKKYFYKNYDALKKQRIVTYFVLHRTFVDLDIGILAVAYNNPDVRTIIFRTNSGKGFFFSLTPFEIKILEKKIKNNEIYEEFSTEPDKRRFKTISFILKDGAVITQKLNKKIYLFTKSRSYYEEKVIPPTMSEKVLTESQNNKKFEIKQDTLAYLKLLRESFTDSFTDRFTLKKHRYFWYELMNNKLMPQKIDQLQEIKIYFDQIIKKNKKQTEKFELFYKVYKIINKEKYQGTPPLIERLQKRYFIKGQMNKLKNQMIKSQKEERQK